VALCATIFFILTRASDGTASLPMGWREGAWMANGNGNKIAYWLLGALLAVLLFVGGFAAEGLSGAVEENSKEIRALDGKANMNAASIRVMQERLDLSLRRLEEKVDLLLREEKEHQ